MIYSIDKLKDAMENNNIGASLIIQNESIRYFSGFTGSNALLLILADKKYLITDFRYIRQAKSQSPGFEVIDAPGTKAFDFISETCTDLKVDSLWFEDGTLTYKQYSNLAKKASFLDLIPDEGKIFKLRILKTEDEVNNIRKAAALADKGFTYLLDFIKSGTSEKKVALELEFYLRKNGSEGLAFPIIAASGPNGALPHAEPSDRMLEDGDFLTLDFGCIVNGYCSDITRTVAIGEPADKLKEIYRITLEAQEKALGQLRPGISCMLVDKHARDHITTHGYGPNFGHGLGHGVGLHVHEEPRLSPQGAETLQPGMVVTIEPGIYIPDLGGVRIEDLVLITKDGYDNLVTSKKDLIII
ncbi:MAG TPA: aminopeptidase P family protein [Bacillota bacterium]|nr:aminopeptidase P family protein [Bacillota bacterium]